jgi:hypothetical protein
VQPISGEPAGIPGEGQAGARDFGFRDLTVQAQFTGQRFKLKRITPACHKIS